MSGQIQIDETPRDLVRWIVSRRVYLGIYLAHLEGRISDLELLEGEP